jgi:hypothetical protein
MLAARARRVAGSARLWAGIALLVVAAVLAAAVSAGSSSSSLPSHPFQTGFMDNVVFGGSWSTLGFERAADAGATVVRLRLNWSTVAPQGSAPPAGFVPTDPNDPHYNWATFDAEVDQAMANGQTPIANIFTSPQWSLMSPPGSGLPATVPDPVKFAQFALAAATRYNGLNGHPRITDWEIWNEPNLGLYFEPQFVKGQPYSASWYRTLVNDAAVAIKSVHADNFVIAGSTAPFYDMTASTVAVNPAWGPLGFMRAVLCLTPQLTLVSGCPKIEFDAWAHHPYTEGGPTHTASLPDDVELGDLPRMKEVLDAAWALHDIVASQPPQLWVTEFSWDSNPPDPGGVPMTLLQRWIPEAMYTMWSDGVDVLTWFLLVDQAQTIQSGLYTLGATGPADQPKPIVQAFRFPFVAYRSAGGIRFWGRTPAGRQPTTVAVEQEDGTGGWTSLGTLPADQYGIFQGRLATTSRLPVRARTTDRDETSVAFSLRTVPDRFVPSAGGAQYEPSRTYGPRPAIPPRWRP